MLSHAERRALAALISELLNQPLAPGGRRQHRLQPPDVDAMTLGEAVGWLARLGGYTGAASGGPPGTITLSRGLETLAIAVKTIRGIEKLGK